MDSIYMNIENDFPKNNNNSEFSYEEDNYECYIEGGMNSEMEGNMKESFDNPNRYDDLNIYDEQYNKYVNFKYYILSIFIILFLLGILMYFLFKK